MIRKYIELAVKWNQPIEWLDGDTPHLITGVHDFGENDTVHLSCEGLGEFITPIVQVYYVKPELTEDLEKHIMNHLANPDYRHFPVDYNVYPFKLLWDRVAYYNYSYMINNLLIIKERIETRGKMTELQQGDVLVRKNGKRSTVTHVWHDRVQDGGGTSGGYMSPRGDSQYSGSLDESIPLESIEPSDEVGETNFWFFSQDWAGAHKAIYFKCPVKVWKEV